MQGSLRAGMRSGVVTAALWLSGVGVTVSTGASQQAEVVVTGRVVDALTGAAVPEAVVTLSAPIAQTVEAGAGGQFSVTLPGPPAPIRVFAIAPGYLRASPGQRGATDNLAGTWSLQPTAGRPTDDVVIRLWREASISGTVVDEDKQPVVGATMIVMTRVFTGSGFRWNEAGVASRRTDDRGQFDLTSLLPGDYLIAVRPPVDPRTGADATPPVTYYPGTQAAADAQVVRLTSGTNARLDLTIDFSTVVGAVRGRFTGVDDVAGFLAHLVPESLAGDASALAPVSVITGGAPLGALTTPVAADGTFAFRGVPRGQYRVKTWKFPEGEVRFTIVGDFQRSMSGTFGPASSQPSLMGAPSGPTWIADMPVVIDEEEPVDITVPLSPGARVRGRVQFEGTKPLPPDDMTSISVVVRPADGAALGPVPVGRVEPDGTFSSVALPPGDYVIGLGQWAGRSSGWEVASILAQGREVVAGTVSLGAADVEDVLIRVTDRPTVLAGTLRDARGQPVRDGRIIVFPLLAFERDQFHASPAQRRVAQALTDRSGAFRLSQPAGEFLVAPVTGDLPAFWMASDYLASLVPAATDVRVPEGRETTVNVTLR